MPIALRIAILCMVLALFLPVLTWLFWQADNDIQGWLRTRRRLNLPVRGNARVNWRRV